MTPEREWSTSQWRELAVTWLDERLGRWDMYVDLRDQTIRYCFRDEADAFAFSRRFVQIREAG